MKAKNIKKVLREKVDTWLETINDEALRKDIKQNCIVTGGAIASMLLDEDINDFDIYFTNKETAFLVAQHYIEKFKSNIPHRFKEVYGDNLNIKAIEENQRVRILIEPLLSNLVLDNKPSINVEQKKFSCSNFFPIFISENAITLSDDIQLIIRFYGSPNEIHENFDFVHCTSYWVSETNELVLRPEALEALLTKELIYVGSKYPIASLIRTRKFIKRGFNCSAGQYLKMAWQVSQLNLRDLNVLKDQLIGIDVIYFSELLNILERTPKSDIDYLYISNIIDRIF